MNSENKKSLASSWEKVRHEYHQFVEITFKSLLQFSSTYLGESGFSTLNVVKTKHRNSLDIHYICLVSRTTVNPTKVR